MHTSLLQINSKYSSTEVSVDSVVPAIHGIITSSSSYYLVSTTITRNFQAGGEWRWSFLETGCILFLKSFALASAIEIS